MTWLRFMLGHILAAHEVDFDSVRDIVPPLGSHRLAPGLLPEGGRVTRTHEPLATLALASGQPVLYLVRDGRDVAVSYFHHTTDVARFSGSPDAFIPAFLGGELDGYGPWHLHALGAQEAPSGGPRLLVVRYEDLRRDTVTELEKVLKHLGLHAEGDQIARAVAANTKERMQAKEKQSVFMKDKRPDGSFVRSDGGATWRTFFGDDARSELETALAPALAVHGYTDDTPDRTGGAPA